MITKRKLFKATVEVEFLYVLEYDEDEGADAQYPLDSEIEDAAIEAMNNSQGMVNYNEIDNIKDLEDYELDSVPYGNNNEELTASEILE